MLAFAPAAAGGLATVTGAPLNMASKLAEDTDERGAAFFEAALEGAARAACGAAAEGFELQKSGVTIKGARVALRALGEVAGRPVPAAAGAAPAESVAPCCCSIT